MIASSKIVITCGKEIPRILSRELTDLGYKIESENKLDVTITGTFEDCLFLNMHLRTAHRVLFLISAFKAYNPDKLYKNIKAIPWEKYLHPDGYISISSYVHNEHIRDTRFANLRVKDGIADRMTSKMGRRPDSGPDRNRAVLFLHWVDDKAAIYFDTSGETIAKHNYRKMPYAAPLMESLASAIILSTKWRGEGHFINPMCGSGTLAIEAALMGLNIAPGLSRANFGFMHLKMYNGDTWKKIKLEAHKKIKNRLGGKIVATDISSKALNAAATNARTAEVEDLIHFEKADFSKTTIPEGDGIVILNPAYGERIGDTEQLIPVYSGIGDFFKNRCSGKTGYIFTGNAELGKKVGLRTRRKIPFYNAKIECRLLEYELYAGSRKEIDK